MFRLWGQDSLIIDRSALGYEIHIKNEIQIKTTQNMKSFVIDCLLQLPVDVWGITYFLEQTDQPADQEGKVFPPPPADLQQCLHL